MENTGTVCTQVADCSLPRSNNHGRGQPQERMGEGSDHQRQCYKVATKRTKREKNYTNC